MARFSWLTHRLGRNEGIVEVQRHFKQWVTKDLKSSCARLILFGAGPLRFRREQILKVSERLQRKRFLKGYKPSWLSNIWTSIPALTQIDITLNQNKQHILIMLETVQLHCLNLTHTFIVVLSKCLCTPSSYILHTFIYAYLSWHQPGCKRH